MFLAALIRHIVIILLWTVCLSVRGKGSFGILAFGSCGFTNADGSLPFPNDQPAAAADASPDFPGSCGRCYEIRCDDSTEVLSE
jgi:hypothetical protein